MKFICRTNLLCFVFGCVAASLSAQTPPAPVNNRQTTEVGGATVQGTNSIFVAAMEGNLGGEETAIYRSTAGGPWVEQFRVGATTLYERAPDPIMAYDGAGRLYMELMRIPFASSFESHIALYASNDQGVTWILQSYPFIDPAFGDYPAITALPGNLVFTSYSEYTLSPLDSWIEFRRSTDGGLSWSVPSRFDGNRNFVGVNFITVGSDLAWVGGRLCLTYGDYTEPHVYFTSSPDSGLTWAPVDTIDLAVPDQFLVTKLVPWEDSDTLFAIAHRPHDAMASIYLSKSLDGGQNWTSQTIATSAAYGEGLQSAPGVLDVVYNKTDGALNFEIQYTWSDDAGASFQGPVTLWASQQNHQGAGEYQAFMPAASGNGFDLVFVDDSDLSELKYLHFTHALIPMSTETPSPAGLHIFPNPAHEVVHIRRDAPTGPAQYRLSDIEGRLLQQGKCTTADCLLDLRDVAAGTYILAVECGNRIDVQRVVKE